MLHTVAITEGLQVLIHREEEGAGLVLLVFGGGNTSSLGHDLLRFLGVGLHELTHIPPGINDFLNIIRAFFDQITADSQQIWDGPGVFHGAGDDMGTITLHGGAGVRRECAHGIHLAGSKGRRSLIGRHALDDHVITAEAHITQSQAQQEVIHNTFFYSNRFSFQITNSFNRLISNDLIITS